MSAGIADVRGGPNLEKEGEVMIPPGTWRTDAWGSMNGREEHAHGRFRLWIAVVTEYHSERQVMQPLAT